MYYLREFTKEGGGGDISNRKIDETIHLHQGEGHYYSYSSGSSNDGYRGQVMTAINITSLTICRDYEAQTLDEMKCRNKLESYHTWPLSGRLRQTPLHLWKKVKDLNAVYENTWFHSNQRNKAAKS